jgi:hypothetical protein
VGRLLRLEPHRLTSRPTAKVLGNIPRPLLSVVDVKGTAMTSVTLSIGGRGKGLLLKYPAVGQGGRRVGAQGVRGDPRPTD